MTNKPHRKATGDGKLKGPDHHRGYRRLVRSGLKLNVVKVLETDLSIYANGGGVAQAAREVVMEQRGHLEHYIRHHNGFLETLTPWPTDQLAPPVVRSMIEAGKIAGVGPMAAVAGAIAEMVGLRLLASVTDEVIVENGGDIFAHTHKPLTVAVYAGGSPLSYKIGLLLDSGTRSQAVCTSSATVGHSLSFGKADAVTVISSSCPMADAAATAIGNRVSDAGQIEAAIEWGRSIVGVEGILVIVGSKMGAWGRLQVVGI